MKKRVSQRTSRLNANDMKRLVLQKDQSVSKWRSGHERRPFIELSVNKSDMNEKKSFAKNIAIDCQ